MSMNYNTNPSGFGGDNRLNSGAQGYGSGYGAQPDIPFSVPMASAQLGGASGAEGVIYQEKRVEAAPISAQGGVNTYQDYNAHLHDYNAPGKKKTLFSLRNILLGVAGLLLGGLLLWGLVAGLRGLLSKNKSKKATKLIKTPTASNALIPEAQNTLVSGAQNALIPGAQGALIPGAQSAQNALIATQKGYTAPAIPGQYTPDQLNAALKAAIAAGALPALGGFSGQDFSKLTPLTLGDLQQLLLVQQQYGSIDSNILRKLGLTEAQYNFLLQNALTNGLLSQEQLRLLIHNPHGNAALGLNGNLLQPTFHASDIQQLLGIAKVSGKFDDKSLSKFGILRSQFLNQLQNAARNGFVSRAQLDKLGVRISDTGILSLKN